jgi:hypothetical protein
VTTPPHGFWRRLRWLYDGEPDLTRSDSPFLGVTGWGPFPLPGEKAENQRAQDRTRALVAEIDAIGRNHTDEGVPLKVWIDGDPPRTLDEVHPTMDDAIERLREWIAKGEQ